MLEAALRLEELLDRLHAALLGEAPHAVLHLEERPEVGLHAQARDFHGHVEGDTPTAGAGSEHVDERGAVGVDGLLRFAHEVLPVADGSLCDIGDVVRGEDGREVLAALHLAKAARTHLGGGGPGAVGGGAGALDARVHVRAVVVAHVHHVVAALHGTRQRLQADVVGTAVAAEGDELDLLVGVDLAGALEGLESGLDARQGRGGVLEGVVDEGNVPGVVRIDRRGNLQASRGAGDDDRRVAGTHEHLTDGDGGTAATAQAVTRGQTAGKLGELLEVGHRRSSFLSGCPCR